MQTKKLLSISNILKDRSKENTTPYIEIGDIDIETKLYSYKDKPSVKGAINAYKDCTIVSKVRPTRGAIGLIKEENISVSNAFCILKPNIDLILPKLLFYFLAYNKDFLSYLGGKSKGTLYPSCKDIDILNFNIPLSTIPTQHLIVQEIEKQFSRLDEGLASLKRTKENLKKYKASVLKSAVEGKLTEEWRMDSRVKHENDNNNESAKDLLKQILQARKEKFLAENPGKKYKEPEAIKKEDLPNIELPEEWEWCKVDYIKENQEYGSSKKADLTGDVPVLRMGNIQDGKLDFSNLKYFEKDNSDLKKLILKDKDLLFNRTNSAELVGKSAIYHKEKHLNPCTFAGYLIRVQAFHELFNIEYLLYFLNSFHGKMWIKSVVVQQVGQANVNGTKLSNLIFPLPPLPEQNEIVKIVESKLSVVEKLEKIVNDNIRKAENLKQSILKKAFEGKLVKES